MIFRLSAKKSKLKIQGKRKLATKAGFGGRILFNHPLKSFFFLRFAVQTFFMKKKIIYCSLAATLFATLNAQAQITIDSSNAPHANQTIVLTEASPSTVNFPAAAASGANVTWDFSTLDSTGLDSMKFENKNTGIKSGAFPEASFVENDAEDSESDYYIKSNTQFGVAGLAGITDGDTAVFHLQIPMLEFPSTYNSNFTKQATDTALIAGGSARIIIHISTTSTIDGWGSLKMPKGTFPVIRQKQTTISQSLIETYMGNNNWLPIDGDTSVDNSFIWWTNNAQIKWPLLEVDYDTDSAIEYVAYVNASPTPNGINELTMAGLQVSPNPANNFLNFSLVKGGSYELTVTDMTGRELMKNQFTGISYRLNTSALPAGIYLYQLSEAGTSSAISGKFVKK